MDFIILGIIFAFLTIILGTFAIVHKNNRNIKIAYTIISGLVTIFSFLIGQGGGNIEVNGDNTTIININSESIQADNIDDLTKRIKEFISTSSNESEDTLTNEKKHIFNI